MPPLGYNESIAVLKERVEIIGDALPEVLRVPRPGDDPVGPSLFRMGLEDVDLGGLCLRGLYVSRTQLARVGFRGCDLEWAAFNWSDIIGCDFSAADLRRSDLRSSRFTRCTFDHALMDEADFRGSTFESCSFAGAALGRTLLQRGGALRRLGIGRAQEGLPLSAEQRAAARWTADAPEAPGG